MSIKVVQKKKKDTMMLGVLKNPMNPHKSDYQYIHSELGNTKKNVRDCNQRGRTRKKCVGSRIGKTVGLY